MATNNFDDGNEVFTQTKHFERLARTWLNKSDVSAWTGHIHPSFLKQNSIDLPRPGGKWRLLVYNLHIS